MILVRNVPFLTYSFPHLLNSQNLRSLTKIFCQCPLTYQGFSRLLCYDDARKNQTSRAELIPQSNFNPGLSSSYVSPWIEVSQKRLFGYVHKYQFDCRQIVEIWYECYKIIYDIIRYIYNNFRHSKGLRRGLVFQWKKIAFYLGKIWERYYHLCQKQKKIKKMTSSKYLKQWLLPFFLFALNKISVK